MKSWAHGWRFWVLLAVIVTGGVLMLAQDQDTLHVLSPIAARERGFTEYVASLVGAPVLKGDAYTVLRNGDEVFPAMLDAIQNAHKRISMESFIYEDGDVGDRFTVAL